MCEGMRTSLKKAGNMDRRFYTQVLRSSAMGQSIITTDYLACLMLVTGDYRSANLGVVRCKRLEENFLNSDKI